MEEAEEMDARTTYSAQVASAFHRVARRVRPFRTLEMVRRDGGGSEGVEQVSNLRGRGLPARCVCVRLVSQAHHSSFLPSLWIAFPIEPDPFPGAHFASLFPPPTCIARVPRSPRTEAVPSRSRPPSRGGGTSTRPFLRGSFFSPSETLPPPSPPREFLLTPTETHGSFFSPPPKAEGVSSHPHRKRWEFLLGGSGREGTGWAPAWPSWAHVAPPGHGTVHVHRVPTRKGRGDRDRRKQVRSVPPRRRHETQTTR